MIHSDFSHYHDICSFNPESISQQAHKITRAPITGTLSASAAYSSNSGGLNNPTSGTSSAFAAESLNSNNTTSNNKTHHSGYTNTATSAYIPSPVDGAFANGGVKYGVDLAEYDGEDGGADIYIEGCVRLRFFLRNCVSSCADCHLFKYPYMCGFPLLFIST